MRQRYMGHNRAMLTGISAEVDGCTGEQYLYPVDYLLIIHLM